MAPRHEGDLSLFSLCCPKIFLGKIDGHGVGIRTGQGCLIAQHPEFLLAIDVAHIADVFREQPPMSSRSFIVVQTDQDDRDGESLAT